MTEPSPFQTLFPLSEGGMGRVEVVVRREGAFQRLYVLKRPHAHLARKAEMRELFEEEARVAGLLTHPNVVPVLDVGADEHGPYLQMDYVESVDLAHFVGGYARRGEPVPVEAALEIGRQLAEGLDAVHELRDPTGQALELLHRDISPQNVLIGFDGTVRLTDFGIAKALLGERVAEETGEGSLRGKIGYMAPEVLRGERPDRRADLFSLGVVLYELLVGERLYGRDVQSVQRILEEAPPDVGERRTDLPASVAALMSRLLAKQQGPRPASAREVAKALRAGLRELATANTTSIDLRDLMETRFGEARNARAARVRQELARVADGTPPLGGVTGTGATAPATPRALVAPPEGAGTTADVAVASSTQRRFPWVMVITIGAAVIAAAAGSVITVAWLERGHDPTATAPHGGPSDPAPARLEPDAGVTAGSPMQPIGPDDATSTAAAPIAPEAGPPADPAQTPRPEPRRPRAHSGTIANPRRQPGCDMTFSQLYGQDGLEIRSSGALRGQLRDVVYQIHRHCVQAGFGNATFSLRVERGAVASVRPVSRGGMTGAEARCVASRMRATNLSSSVGDQTGRLSVTLNGYCQ